jgi:hypothetical protein
MKALFETGDIPTQTDFADGIDSSWNLVDNGQLAYATITGWNMVTDSTKTVTVPLALTGAKILAVLGGVIGASVMGSAFRTGLNTTDFGIETTVTDSGTTITAKITGTQPTGGSTPYTNATVTIALLMNIG